MKNNYAKLFLDKSNNKILQIKYSPDKDDYYTLVREHHKNGYTQIIITSKIMTSIIEDYFYNKSFRISSIEFMEEDDNLKRDIEIILDKLKEDRAYFGKLLNKIKFLSEDTAIDIKKIELRGKNNKEQCVSIFVQVNGVIGINEKCFNEELEMISKIIERHLN